MGLWQACQHGGGRRWLLTLALALCALPTVRGIDRPASTTTVGRLEHASTSTAPDSPLTPCRSAAYLPPRAESALDSSAAVDAIVNALRSGQNVLVKADAGDDPRATIGAALHRLQDQHRLPERVLWLTPSARPADLLTDDLLRQACAPKANADLETQLQQLGQRLALRDGLLVLDLVDLAADRADDLSNLLCSLQGVQTLTVGAEVPRRTCRTAHVRAHWTTVSLTRADAESCQRYLKGALGAARTDATSLANACSLLGGESTAIKLAGMQLANQTAHLTTWLEHFRAAIHTALREHPVSAGRPAYGRSAALFQLALHALSPQEQALLLSTGLIPAGSPLSKEFLRFAAGYANATDVESALHSLESLGLLQWDEQLQRYTQAAVIRDQAARYVRHLGRAATLLQRAATDIIATQHRLPDDPPLLNTVLQHLAARYRKRDSPADGRTLVAWASQLRSTTRYPNGFSESELALTVAYGAAVEARNGRAALTVAQTIAELAQHAGDTGQALQWYARALAQARRMQAGRDEGQILEHLGQAEKHYGELDRAIEYLAEAFHVAQRTGETAAQARRLSLLANAYLAQGESRMAIANLEQALAIARTMGDLQQEARDLGQLGIAYRDLGHVRVAIEHHTRSLAIARDLGATAIEGAQLENLGTAHRMLGNTDEAVRYLQRALQLARVHGDNAAESHLLAVLGETYLEQQTTAQAIACYEEALTIARQRRDRIAENTLLGNIAAASKRHGDLAKASDFYQQALSGAQYLGDQLGEGHNYWQLGQLQLQRGQVQEAVHSLQRAVRLAAQLGDLSAECQRRITLGDAEHARRHVAAARLHWEEAWQLLPTLPEREATDLRRKLSERLQPATASATAEGAQR